MKYLAFSVKHLFCLFVYLVAQTLVVLWHLNLKHTVSYHAFMNGDWEVSAGDSMLTWTVIFLVTAIINAIFGFGGLLSHETSAIPKILFFIFLVLFVLSLIAGGFRRID